MLPHLIFGLLFLIGASIVQAQIAPDFPLTSLSVTVAANLNGNAVPASPTLYPPFSVYRTKNLRYAAEISVDDPLQIQFNWVGGVKLVARDCDNDLNQPTSSSYSYCPYALGTTYNPGQPVIINADAGTRYIELAVYSTAASFPSTTTTTLYVITLAINTDVGHNMLTMSTDFNAATVDKPFVLSLATYAIRYKVAQAPSAGTNIAVPFYLDAQQAVDKTSVQECHGVTCDLCEIDRTLNPPKSITVPRGSGISAVGFDSKPMSGQYTFAGTAGNNCFRLINTIDAGTLGTNEYTITVNLAIKNCGTYSSCTSCATDLDCGWCLSNFAGLVGDCRVGTALGATSKGPDPGQAEYPNCVPKSNAFAVPRFIYGAANCITELKGDPRISGLQGQDFQVHGTPNEYFNLFTASDLQVNSRFVFLEEAECDNFTACFSHAGTYIDEIGFMAGENKIRLVAGSIREPTRVFINGKEIQPSSHKHAVGDMTVTFAHPRRAIVKTSHVIMTISQSDKFFNVDSALMNSKLMDEGSKLVRLTSSYSEEQNNMVHGLIGQTWRNRVYLGNREYEGEVPDYQVADGLWGSDFHFNLYQN